MQNNRKADTNNEILTADTRKTIFDLKVTLKTALGHLSAPLVSQNFKSTLQISHIISPKKWPIVMKTNPTGKTHRSTR